MTGDPDSPTYHLLNHLKLDDNEASATLKAEVGPDATWKNVSDGSDRNTNTSGDSVQEIGRGRNLDTQNGAGYIEMAVGAGTVHDNAFLKKGSILIKFRPEFTYNVGAHQGIFDLFYDSNNNIWLDYDYNDDRFELTVLWGGSQTELNSSAYTENYSLQKEHTILAAWDSDKDWLLLAIGGQVVACNYETGTPTSSEPVRFYIGCYEDRSSLADIIIDEIKTFNEAILPYGAFFTGIGEVDANVAHKDITAYIKGNESNNDSLQIGTGNIIVSGATKTTDVQGNANSAFLFDANSELIKISTANYNASKGSISFWYKSNDTSPSTYAAFFTDDASAYNFTAYRDNSNTALTFSINSIDFDITHTNFYDTKWHYLKFIWNADENRKEFWLNGLLEATSSASFTAPTKGTYLEIGCYSAYPTDFADGVICDFTITNDDSTPEIWTAFGKPLHLPKTLDTDVVQQLGDVYDTIFIPDGSLLITTTDELTASATLEFLYLTGNVGTVCWGHDTSVTQVNVRDFTGNITAGSGYRIVGSGDSEKVEFESGGYIELETWNLGVMLCEITKDQYNTGSGTLTIKYKNGSTEANCDADTWNTYSVPFACTGWIKIRVEESG